MPPHRERANRNIERGTNAALSFAGSHDTQRAAIHAAGFGFEPVDQAHGLHLRRARDGAAGEEGGKHIDQSRAALGAGGHIGGHLPHRRQGLDGEQARHLDAVGLRDARHVVAQQVHDHHVFCALLGGAAQVLGPGLVFLLVGTARGRALHRTGEQGLAVPVEKQLGRQAQNLLAVPMHARHIAIGLDAAQRLEQRFG